jgi:ubiquinone biosynthesis protein UbiJ
MLHTLHSLLAPSVVERLTLVINHVLGSEAVATERLRPHAGRRIELQFSAWPGLLPAPPALVWRITPAGLLEWQGLQPEPGADLQVRLDAANPAALAARLLAGEPPPLQIDGDAQLAGDINWLSQNLRWDVAADLERLFGPAVAQQLHRAGQALGGALRAAVRGAQGLGERLRPRSPE